MDESKGTEVEQPVVLNERDIEIFRLIHEHRYAAHSHLKMAFWTDNSEEANACYRRIEKLTRAEYLRKGYSRKKNLNLYLLTEKGLDELRRRNLDAGMRLYAEGPYFDRYIDHDLKVMTVRLIFGLMGLKEWTGERSLKERGGLNRVPDGILSIHGRKIAIEFENYITKGRKRYTDLFDFYKSSPEYDLVFMILDGDTKDWLVGLEYDAQQLWFITYEDFIQKREEALLENKRASFVLNRILP
ncbi:MAG: hypothetical protein Q8P24_16420 [Desulfobacterales bacterium]|nr:hypothetical protein [Desulfobacterales bacterium]